MAHTRRHRSRKASTRRRGGLFGFKSESSLAPRIGKPREGSVGDIDAQAKRIEDEKAAEAKRAEDEKIAAAERVKAEDAALERDAAKAKIDGEITAKEAELAAVDKIIAAPRRLKDTIAELMKKKMALLKELNMLEIRRDVISGKVRGGRRRVKSSRKTRKH